MKNVSRPISWRVAGLLLLSCARPTRAVQFPIPLFEGVAKAALYCAHGTSTVSSCAFCEQEGHLAAPSPSLQAFSLPLKDSAAWLIPYCARRTTVIYLYYPSNLARTPFTRGGPIGLPLRATFSPAHLLARRDAPIARARAVQFSIPLFGGAAEAALYCAHRATTASSWGLCEQEGHLAAPPSSFRFFVKISRLPW
jgi:hypothetical protein